MIRWATIIDETMAQTPATAWLKGDKRGQVIHEIKNDYDFGLLTIDFITDMRRLPTDQRKPDLILSVANRVAQKAPIIADPKKFVFFSGTSQGRAEQFVNDNVDYNVIHTTLPGALLEMLNLFDENLNLTREQRYQPWNTLSSRVAHRVEDDATAILDKPKPTATFVNYEMPTFLLENKKLFTVNDVDKWMFWNALEILDLSVEHAVEHKKNILNTHVSQFS